MWILSRNNIYYLFILSEQVVIPFIYFIHFIFVLFLNFFYSKGVFLHQGIKPH